MPFGFRIMRPLDIGEWKILPVTPDIPFEYVRQCPSHCAAGLKTLAVITGSIGDRRIRVGYCSDCGYMGYQDRPTDQWMKDFYRDTWDSGKSAKKVRRASPSHTGRTSTINDSLRLIAHLPLDPMRPVCEIGCGYGESLMHLWSKGFRNMVGFEASEHRVRAAADALGIPVSSERFEDADHAKLEAYIPFGLIFSHHVLEHVSDPDRVIAQCAALQQEGDYLVLSVPDVRAESSMAILMFLPHLHSFSFETLRRLLERHGYEIISRSDDPRILTVAARKTKGGSRVKDSVAVTPVYALMQERLIRRLGLDTQRTAHARRFWWLKKSDTAGQSIFLGDGITERIHHAWVLRMHKMRGAGRPQSVLIEDLPVRVVASRDAPVELQWLGHASLFYK